MWRAIIVDDEPIIRFGIKASVDWSKEGVELVADCANGAEALQLLEKEPVDLLITDIKMPVLDGLALSKRVLELYPETKVVLVSSHNDFEYVREGLKLGVTDYILKHTLEPEELQQVVRRCLVMLEKEARKKGQRVDQVGNGEEMLQLRKRCEGELKLLLLQKEGKPQGDVFPAWLDHGYLGLAIVLNRVSLIEEQQGYLFKSVVLEQLAEALYGEEQEGIAVQTAEHELFFLLPAPQSREEQASRLRKLKAKMEEESGASVTIGFARGEETAGIREAYSCSRLASDRGFFVGSGIYGYESSDAVRRDGLRLPSSYQSLEGADDERLAALLTEWRIDWSHGGCSPLSLKEEASKVLSMMFKQQVDPYALVESFDRLFKTETLGELCEVLQTSIVELRKACSDSFDAQSSYHPIDKALDYIRGHYLESMTLQQVADYVHVSKNYFSILFKKITGQNFIDYVITLRVQRAKELLGGTELKVYEVAERSGFNDVKYFSKLFKKMTGHSPVEYRERRLPPASAVQPRRGGERQ
ncbi:response regulator [Paenibacillus sp. LHD-117]|uniref:response regulator transcription factor n=1 Tax=Paenibacillus sp. LHD-117 TaxID=3071412 RepID=UPI0027DFB825|nr:response regulator [Paenibacillus sp. LHD-117]MDQ6419779.1 response regulator [Paenibacillus sp. LHD-117]